MRTYELMVIHRPDLSETDVQSAVSDVEVAISADGEVENRDLWGKRRFAYEIDHQNEGHYSVVRFQGSGELVNRLDTALGLQDQVIRHKIVRVA
ncbi:MAG: 30S ribosomal protein S6 [Acidimicrobiia bacterium]|nr:30S ribosomal protein S6 [Acidimicrobiia bacterium]